MELTHEPGCDLRHTKRQRCNMPREAALQGLSRERPKWRFRSIIAPAPWVSVSPITWARLEPQAIEPQRALSAMLLELAPVLALVTLVIMAQDGVDDAVWYARAFIIAPLFVTAGLGWVYAGRPDLGVLIFGARVLVLVLLGLAASVWYLDTFCDDRQGACDTSRHSDTALHLAITCMAISSAICVASAAALLLRAWRSWRKPA